MSHLTGKALRTQMDVSLAIEAASHATAYRQDTKVVQAMGSPEDIFAQGSDISIVSQCHSQSQAVAQHGSQGHNAFPRHVGRVDDATGREVATGCTDAHRTYALVAAIGLDERQDMLTQFRHKITDIRVVCSRKRVLDDNISTNIDNGTCRLVQLDVNANHSGLHVLYNHSSDRF